jgi:hypothetical protein
MPKIGNTSTNSKPANPTLTERHNAAIETLATRYDALNEKFVAAENKLKALKPLRPAWVDYDTTSQEDGPTYWDLLGLYKLDGKWRLVHAVDNELNDDGSGPYDLKPITECSIEIRIRAAKEVRRLHEEIVKQKESAIPKVEEAIAELTKYCTEV